MVIINIKYTDLCKELGKKISISQLEEELFDFGLELKKQDGNDLTIELTAERSDLVSLQGLARALKNYIGLDEKIPEYKIKKPQENYFVNVENLPKQWPFVVCAIVKELKFDNEKIKEVMRVQEKLASSFLRNRKKGGIGIYPLDKIKMPIKFIGKKPEKIKFCPLEFKQELTANQILELHPTGKKYAQIINKWEKYPVFIDANDNIMSLPPIINSNIVGKITPNTNNIFIESTGINLSTIQEALNIICMMFAEMGGNIYSIDIIYKNKTITTPDLKPFVREVSIKYINKILGLNLDSKQIQNLLKKMMYEIHSVKDDIISVKIPKTRVDIWHQIDIVDDVAKAYKFNKYPLSLPQISTIGSTLPITKIEDQLSQIMVGLGFTEIYTLGLSSTTDQFEKMNLNINEQKHISIKNSAEQGINTIRKWLIADALKSLHHNKNNPTPQKIFECGFVVIPDEKQDVKSKTIKKLSACICNNIVTFTQIKQVLNALLCVYDLNIKIEKLQHNSFIEGRCGKIIAGKRQIGIIGEINPIVLENWSIINPVACFEINVEKLLELIK